MLVDLCVQECLEPPTWILKSLEPLSKVAGEQKSSWGSKGRPRLPTRFNPFLGLWEEGTLVSHEAHDDIIQGSTVKTFSLGEWINQGLFRSQVSR